MAGQRRGLEKHCRLSCSVPFPFIFTVIDCRLHSKVTGVMLSNLESGHSIRIAFSPIPSWTYFLFNEKFSCSLCSMQVNVATFTFKMNDLNNETLPNNQAEPIQSQQNILLTYTDSTVSSFKPETKLPSAWSGDVFLQIGTGLMSLLFWGLMYKHLHTFIT